MIKDLCVENAFFIEEFQVIKEKHALLIKSGVLKGSLEETTALHRCALRLYYKFIGPDSPYQLNISSDSERRIFEELKKLCITDFSMFENVLQQVHLMIYENTYQRYAMKHSVLDALDQI